MRHLMALSVSYPLPTKEIPFKKLILTPEIQTHSICKTRKCFKIQIIKGSFLRKDCLKNK